MKKTTSKKLRLFLFIIWVFIGIILIALPLLMGDSFEIQPNKKFVYFYIIGSIILPHIVNYSLKC